MFFKFKLYSSELIKVYFICMHHQHIATNNKINYAVFDDGFNNRSNVMIDFDFKSFTCKMTIKSKTSNTENIVFFSNYVSST